MPPIVAGQSFTDLLAFKEALRQWAIEASWTPHILDSDSHRVRAGCRSSPNCPFRIRANYSAKRGDAKVTTVEDDHNCQSYTQQGPAHQYIKRAETGKLKFLQEVVPKLMEVTLDTPVHAIIDVVEQHYGQRIPIRQAQKVKGSLVTRVKGPCRHCHRMGHTRRKCPQLRDSAPGPMNMSNGGLYDYSQNEDDETFDGGGGMDYDDDGDGGEDNHFVPMPYPPPPQAQMTTPSAGATQTALQTFQNGQRHVGAQEQRTPDRGMGGSGGLGGSTTNAISASSTPGEIRTEASRLMQQATMMMQRAAEMNAEATRLLARVGEGT